MLGFIIGLTIGGLFAFFLQAKGKKLQSSVDQNVERRLMDLVPKSALIAAREELEKNKNDYKYKNTSNYSFKRCNIRSTRY